MSATLIEISILVVSAVAVHLSLRSDNLAAKKVLAVVLCGVWAYLVLNATPHFLENVVPFMHGALRFDWPWPWWAKPWW